MTIGVGTALLILAQNDDDGYDARRYGSLVTPRRYIINYILRCHFSSIFSNLLMTPPRDTYYALVFEKL